MKTILAGTDFTPSSVNACRYAALVAQKLNCKLVIFNLYEIPVYHSNAGLIGINFPALKKKSKQKIDTIIKDLAKDFPALKMGTLESTDTMKDLLKDYTNKHQVMAVVMGLAAKDKISKFIYGSSGVKMGGKLEVPVIIVPGKYTDHHLETLLLAIDTKEKPSAVSSGQIARFVAGNQLYLKVLHVRTPQEVISPAKTNVLKIGPTRQNIEARNAITIERGIKKYCSENGIDMVAIISRKHSIFYGLFNESQTKAVAFASSVPVLVLHE